MDPKNRYYFPVIGHNFRLTNVACALLCAQLERRIELVRQRNRVFAAYREKLEEVDGIGFQPVADWAEPAPWMFCITVDEALYGRSQAELMSCLEENGIETRPFFIPIHRLPPYEEIARKQEASLPVTDQLARTGLNLPSYPALMERELEYICDKIRSQKV